MKNQLIAFLFFLAFLSLNHINAQSPWTPAKNSGFAQIGMTTIPSYSSVFDADLEAGAFTTPRTVSDVEFQLYAEYGLTDKTTLLFILPYKSVQTGDINSNATGQLEESQFSSFGNINLGVKHQFLNKNLKLAGFLVAANRVENWDESAGLRTGYDAWLINGGLSAGGGWNNSYTYLSTGFQWASANISHSFVSSFEIGTTLADMVTLAFVINTRLSLNNIEDDNLTISTDILTGLYANNQEAISPGLKIFTTLKSGWGVSLGAYGAMFANHYAASPSINLSVFKKW
jgi:hypothetical protein